MVSRKVIAEAARAAKRGGQPAWIPRPTSMQLYQGTINSVDHFNGVVDFETNDPSGLVLPGVRVLQAYSPSNPTGVGHVAVGVYVGTDFYVIGQHVVPNSIVIP